MPDSDDLEAAIGKLEHAADEVAGELVVEQHIRALYETDPMGVASRLAANRRPHAAYALWRLAPADAMRRLGAERTAQAYIRWEQPSVPGWWDGWARSTLEWAIEEWDADEVLPFLAAVVRGDTPAEVLRWFETLLEDVVRYRSSDLLPMLRSDALDNEGLRTALDHAVRHAAEDPLA